MPQPEAFVVENELVAQKDYILALINGRVYARANELLTFSAGLWAACGYVYKTMELRRRIKDEVWAALGETDPRPSRKERKEWADLLAQLPY